MAIFFNHTIVAARDSAASAKFLAEMLGLPAPKQWGPFEMVTTENDASIDFLNVDERIHPQHYAFLVSEQEFDTIFGRVKSRSLPFWADPSNASLAQSTAMTAVAASISKTPTAIFWKSSPNPMAAAAGIRDTLVWRASCKLKT